MITHHLMASVLVYVRCNTRDVAEKLTLDIRAWSSSKHCSKTDLPVNYGQGINRLQANVDSDGVDGPNN
jgi:hypothetical protein